MTPDRSSGRAIVGLSIIRNPCAPRGDTWQDDREHLIRVSHRLLDDCLLHMKLVGYSFFTMCFRLTRHENTAVIHASSEDVISITPAGKRMSTAESADLQVRHSAI